MKIACIQETKLNASSKLPSFPNYAVLRRDRPVGGGGGLITLVHHSIPFIELPSPFNDSTETIIVKAEISNNSFTIANVYIPPQSSCPPNFSASLLPLLVSEIIVVGDINGHNELWSSGANDVRGDALADEIDSKNAVVLNNPDFFTRPTSSSSPDLAVVPPNLALSLSWNIVTSLNSDHLPFCVNFDGDTPPTRSARSFTNFRKADWAAFEQCSEDQFSRTPLPTSCSAGEKVWRHILQKASARSIPSGFRSDFCPGIDPDSARLMKERDDKRRTDPNDADLPDLNQRISASIAAASRKRWMETVMDADRRSNPSRWWNLLKGLAGGQTRQAPNQPISFNDKVFSKKSRIADQFCHQYANVKPFKTARESRDIFRIIKQENPLDRAFTPFTAFDTAEAIRRSKNSTAAGPNDITPLHLKHLGPQGLAFLTRLYNLSVRDACVPVIWRSANVVPVLKPGKTADQGTSYRPISLLCPEFKVLERLLLPALSASLKPNPNQHGFRPERSTVSAMMPLVTTVTRGFNQRKPADRTGLICVDISKAFDVVRRDLLLKKVAATDLHPNLKRWLASNLVDRRVRVLFQGAASKWKKSKLGLPQGAVSSPLLWNFFTDKLDDIGFADDFHATAVSPAVDEISAGLNTAAVRLSTWTAENDMSISAPKSTITLFTPWTKQVNVNLDVEVGEDPVPTAKNPRLLGILLDPMFTFSAHSASIARRASARLNILRALADTNFGKDKECLLLSHKCFIRSLFNYAAPIVYPYYSAASIEKLQKVQNKSLRLATGCHVASSIEHLHAEAKELPVKEHLHLLSAQYLARSLQPHHVNYPLVTLDQGPRKMKDTLRSKVLSEVSPYLEDDGSLRGGNYVSVRNKLHTDAVHKYMSNAKNNRVIGQPPPPVHTNENHLPRLIRVTLAQLRSGFCARLRDFQFRINKSPDDLCQSCLLGTQNVHHIFDCPARPTTLTTNDLWENPWGVADFLRTVPDFTDLPPPAPPRPPRPPPRPPDSPVFTLVTLPPSPFPFSPPSPFSLSPPPSPPLTPPRPLVPPLLSLSLFLRFLLGLKILASRDQPDAVSGNLWTMTKSSIVLTGKQTNKQTNNSHSCIFSYKQILCLA